MLQWAKEFLHENPDMHGPDDPLQVPLAFPQRAPPVQLPPLQTYDEKWAEDYLSEVPVLPGQDQPEKAIGDGEWILEDLIKLGLIATVRPHVDLWSIPSRIVLYPSVPDALNPHGPTS